MGLMANKNNITQKAWDKVYQESCLLLRKFPLPLARIVDQKKYGFKYLAYSDQLIEEEGTSGENWRVYGDMLSQRYGEDFQLYRDVTKGVTKNVVPEKDILWAPIESISFVNGNGATLFYEKTQGYPYHLAILAVAILFESRFPQNAYCIGDFDVVEAEKAILWANTLLKIPLRMPIVLDSKRLYKRLKEAYEDPLLAMERCDSLSRESHEKIIGIMLKVEEKELVYKYLQKFFQRFTAPSQMGFLDLISTFLNATEDLPALLSCIIEAHQDDPKFALSNLLTILGEHFITIPKKERTVLDTLNRALKAQNKNPDNRLYALLAQYLYLPYYIDYYIDKATLLATFSALQPENKASFEAIIEKCHQGCQKKLKKWEDVVQKGKSVDGIDFQPKVATKGRHSAARSPVEQYILGEAQRQKIQFGATAVKELRKLGSALREKIEKDKLSAYFTTTDKVFYVHGILKNNAKWGPILPISCWDRIEQEENLDILRLLFMLSCLSGNELALFQTKQYIFNHSTVWPYLLGK